MQILVLEQLFQRRSSEFPEELPSGGINYFTQYQHMVNVFRSDYYSKIDAGLAANSDLPGFYTAHDAEHFDQVVIHAGILLNAKAQLENARPISDVQLNAYELYLLLAAIRVHDVGNMYGRKGHEKKCFQILREMGGATGPDNAEKKIIASIAQAHGGETSLGSKDTINSLELTSDFGSVSYRPRLLAGIVRIADEICENRGRAATKLLDAGKLPKHSEIYHRYAASVKGNRWNPADRALYLKFNVTLNDVEKPWGCETRKLEDDSTCNEVYLIDEILRRIEKMDRERRYCNLFTRELFTIDAIKVQLDVVNEEHDVIMSIKVPELSDRGYPEDQGVSLTKELHNYCGPEFGASLRKRIQA